MLDSDSQFSVHRLPSKNEQETEFWLTEPEGKSIDQAQIDRAVVLLVEAAWPDRIVLFGSHARGDVRENSDLDLLVIQAQVENRAWEMVRLRRVLRSLRIPVDILVYSSQEVQHWSNQPGTALFLVMREGKVLYG